MQKMYHSSTNVFQIVSFELMLKSGILKLYQLNLNETIKES